MPAVEFGAAREIWFANQDTPATKDSFLVRDDAVSVASANIGRTARLGEPVDVGPTSAWVQKSWVGGFDQQAWQDKAMFDQGSADPATEKGKLQLWPGIAQVYGHSTRGVDRYCFARGGVGNGTGASQLWFGEANLSGIVDSGTGTTTPAQGFALFRVAPGGTAVISSFFASGIIGIANITDWNGASTSTWLLVQLANGEFWLVNTTDDTKSLETTSWANTYAINGMTTFADGLYYVSGTGLWKRISSQGTGTVHSRIKTMETVDVLRNITVWNNRLWFTGTRADGTSMVFTSDGVNVTLAFQFPGTLHLTGICAHRGALYFIGYQPTANGTRSSMLVVYRYTGTDLTLLYSEGTGRDSRWHLAIDIISHGKYVVWGRPHRGDNRAGLMYYDPAQDALFTGPTLFCPTGQDFYATSLCSWDNSLAIGFWDAVTSATNPNATYIGVVRQDGKVRNTVSGYGGLSFGAQPASQTNYLLSSETDGGVQGEQKAWLKATLRCKVPVDTAIDVYALLDDNPTEYLVGTQTAIGSGWQNITFSMKAADGRYMKSSTLRYKVYLKNVSADANTTATPVIDAITVSYVVAPRKRRQWRIRASLSDAQKRLSGVSNPNATAAAIGDALELKWSNGYPLWFWPPSSTPDDNADGRRVEVAITDFLRQEFRLDSQATAIGGEVAMTLTEVV